MCHVFSVAHHVSRALCDLPRAMRPVWYVESSVAFYLGCMKLSRSWFFVDFISHLYFLEWQSPPWMHTEKAQNSQQIACLPPACTPPNASSRRQSGGRRGSEPGPCRWKSSWTPTTTPGRGPLPRSPPPPPLRWPPSCSGDRPPSHPHPGVRCGGWLAALVSAPRLQFRVPAGKIVLFRWISFKPRYHQLSRTQRNGTQASEHNNTRYSCPRGHV